MPAMTMNPPTAADLFGMWDASVAEPSVTRRAISLLSAVCRQPVDAVAALTVGARDGLLLTLREWIFGPELLLRSNCPACGEAVESSLSVGELRIAGAVPDDCLVLFESQGHRVRFRLPDSSDLHAIESLTDVGAARETLLARCVPGFEALPSAVVSELSVHMGELDAQADIHLNLQCPACDKPWSAPFDIASFLCAEIHAWGSRLLREVHVLASCYGWSEHDIVMLSPARRQAYLEMVSGE